jgi:MFS family permease
LWWAAATSNIGDGIRVTALPLLIATLTRDPLLVSGVTAATLAPWILFSLPGGAIVDRSNRRTLMVAGQVVRALFVAILAVAVATGWESIPLIYATAFVIGVGEVFVDTSLQASIPMLVDESQLEDANGKLLAVEFVTNDALGGPVGALLFATAAFVPFGLDAVTFLLGAFLITRITTPLQEPPTDEQSRMLQSIREGIAFVKNEVVLGRIAVAVALVNLAIGAGGSILVLLALEELGTTEFGFGLLIGAGAIGGFLGTLAAKPASRALGRRWSMTGGTLILAAGQLTIGLAPNGPVAGIGLAVGFFGISVFSVVGRALRQAVTPDRILGRVVTSFRFIAVGAAPIGALLGGFVARIAGLRAPYRGGAVVLAVVAILVFTPLTEARVTSALSRRSAQ